MSERKKVLSLTQRDFVFEVTKGSGPGGQHRNTASTAVRCKHPASGAVGYSQKERSQLLNKRLAFKRVTETKEFQSWVSKQISLDLVSEQEIEAKVRHQMNPKNLKVEVQEDGLWVEEELDA